MVDLTFNDFHNVFLWFALYTVTIILYAYYYNSVSYTRITKAIKPTDGRGRGIDGV